VDGASGQASQSARWRHMVQKRGGTVLKQYEEAAAYILETIMKRQRYGFDVRDKIAAHIAKTHREMDQARIRKEAKLLLHRTE
jgi:hypothetical protein